MDGKDLLYPIYEPSDQWSGSQKHGPHLLRLTLMINNMEYALGSRVILLLGNLVYILSYEFIPWRLDNKLPEFMDSDSG